MALWRRGTTEETAAVPGQRSEPALPPDAGRDEAAPAVGQQAPGQQAPGGVQGGQEPQAPVTPAPGDTPTVPTEPVRPDASRPDAATPGQPGQPGQPESREPGKPQDHKLRHTRLSGAWAAVVAGAVVLILLLIFILQNSNTVQVNYLGAHGHLGLGVALLFAAVAGILLTALAGSARIMQLRGTARKHRRTEVKAAKADAKAAKAGR
jgi:uncharacterized integral membrane protein